MLDKLNTNANPIVFTNPMKVSKINYELEH
jgi:hypothetical protein